ncbi:MAG: SOS response-associated peptidase [Deltaproteobacteria bacterium]|jgi:putative SOS response-associated peptidase YedK|nr:SOS response-associated peptidase [Deltaproteobacteria bacterium]
MCGRFATIDLEQQNPVTELIENFLSSPESQGLDLKLKGDVFPTDSVPVLIFHGKLIAKAMTWGFPGFPQKNKMMGKSKPKPLINTRCETALELKTWHDATLNRRCLIPASGFYEWKRQGNKVLAKYLLYLKDVSTIFLGGIYNEISREEEKLPHFSIMTKAANGSMSDIHDRMPLIVRPSKFSVWFSNDFSALFAQDSIVLSRRNPGITG